MHILLFLVLDAAHVLLKSAVLDLGEGQSHVLGMSNCPPHEWQSITGGECPYGHGFFQVTWPDPAKALRYNLTDTMRTDFVQGPIASGFMAFYGYVPYLTIGLAVGSVLRKSRSTQQLYFVVFAATATLLNEINFQKHNASEAT